MALMHPERFPHDLGQRPKLSGEADVFRALAATLDDGWHVFHDWAVSGTRRRVDFLCLSAARGILAIEVKGGLVHAKRGAFRQLVGRVGHRKKIDPFGQLKLGLAEVRACLGDERAVPTHLAIWFPLMGQGSMTWAPSPHILTRELLEPTKLRERLAGVLAEPLGYKSGKTVEQLIGALLARKQQIEW